MRVARLPLIVLMKGTRIRVTPRHLGLFKTTIAEAGRGGRRVAGPQMGRLPVQMDETRRPLSTRCLHAREVDAVRDPVPDRGEQPGDDGQVAP